MTLEQAIEFCLRMEEEQYKSAHNTIIGDYPEYEAAPHFRLASEYKQLADWLKELKELKESKDTQSVIHSRWLPMNDGTCNAYCENCGQERGSKSWNKNDFKFCFGCGAKMDGEQNE